MGFFNPSIRTLTLSGGGGGGGGAQGAQGRQGAQGASGAPGTSGAQGFQGAVGAQRTDQLLAPTVAPSIRITPNRVIRQSWDLIGMPLLTNGLVTLDSGAGFVVSSPGTVTLLPNTLTERGFQQLSTGAGATASCGISGSASVLPYFITSADGLYFAGKFQIPVLSTTTPWKGFWGLVPSATVTPTTTGWGFLYDVVSSGDVHFQMLQSDAASIATPVTTSIVVPTSLVVVEIIKPPGSSVSSFYVNGVLAGTMTGNLPTAALAVQWALQKVSGAGAVAMNMDWGLIDSVFVNGRDPTFLA